MSRRMTLATGAVLLAAGAFALTGSASITTKEQLLQLGDVKISADERRPIPPWAGGVAAGIGLVVLLAGARQRP
jgi:uncharacterized membrane protein